MSAQSLQTEGKLLKETMKKICPPDTAAMEQCQKRWDSIAKPLHSLGRLEEVLIQTAGMTGSDEVHFGKKALIVMCADNGVVEEGISQTGQEVTAVVAENFLSGDTSAAIMCKAAGADLFPVDIGIARDTKLRDEKIAYGTKNMAREWAMTRAQAVCAIETGIRMAEELAEKGYEILATGEMGIGNTTTSSAVAAVLLEKPVEEMTGRGAGLTSAALKRKQEVIKKAVELHQPDRTDGIDVLAKVGGFDLGGMAGVFLGGAAKKIPVIIDGFISAAAALLAATICPEVKSYMLASHLSKEPAMQMILEALGKKPLLTCEMCLGEGTGAVAIFPLLQMAEDVYKKMSTFGEISIDRILSAHCHKLSFLYAITNLCLRFKSSFPGSTDQPLLCITCNHPRHSSIRNCRSFCDHSSKIMSPLCFHDKMTVHPGCKSRTDSDNNGSILQLRSKIFLCKDRIYLHIWLIPVHMHTSRICDDRDFLLLQTAFQRFFCRYALCNNSFHLGFRLIDGSGKRHVSADCRRLTGLCHDHLKSTVI